MHPFLDGNGRTARAREALMLLDQGDLTLDDLTTRTAHIYAVRNPHKALVRDLNSLIGVGAISARRLNDRTGFLLSVNLDWPAKITETEFLRRVRGLPKDKVHGFLSS